MIFKIKHHFFINRKRKLLILIPVACIIFISLHFTFSIRVYDAIALKRGNAVNSENEVKDLEIENNNISNNDAKKGNKHQPIIDTIIEQVKDIPVTENKNDNVDEDKFKIVEQFYVMNRIKKEPYYDRYGVDLNEYMIDGMLNKAINNSTDGKIEDWDLYTPPCPNLHPVHYPDVVLNPVCEDIGIPFYKVTHKNNNYHSIPAVLRLHDITDQMEKWKEWNSKDNPLPNYRNASLDELLNENYHPFDYGYDHLETNEDNDYYSEVVKSPMDRVPDPRRRRLFSIILFNSEFELLDLYLSEYYEIVDYFIIYESNSTFSGYKKPLYLTRTLLETNRYEKFRDKIIPITLPVLEIKSYSKRGPGFPREHLARREVIEKGLRAVHARHGDLFIHGDLDEMPKGRLLSFLKKCGGWEHLQMGIGGGPKLMEDSITKNNIKTEQVNVTKDKFGQFNVDYHLRPSLPFTTFFHEYSFHTIKNSVYSDFFHPNIAIFDARRALGQIPEFNNDGTKFDVNKSRKINARGFKNDANENINYYIKSNRLFNTSKFDPYWGYTYSNNSNNRKKGEGYLGENAMRFSSDIKVDENGKLVTGEVVGFWKSGWHLSTFLPNVKQFFNKVTSYSHFNFYNKLTDEEKIKELIYRVQNNYYIFGRKTSPMDTLDVKIPVTEEEKYPNMFSYQLWSQIIEEYNTTGKSSTFNKLNDLLIHEIPNQIMENPICYSYMLDRDFGFTKKLWWEIIPKKEWNTVDFSQLDQSVIDQLSPLVNENNKV